MGRACSRQGSRGGVEWIIYLMLGVESIGLHGYLPSSPIKYLITLHSTLSKSDMTGRPSETELRNNRGECRLDRFHLAQIRPENSQANYVLIYSRSCPHGVTSSYCNTDHWKAAICWNDLLTITNAWLHFNTCTTEWEQKQQIQSSLWKTLITFLLFFLDEYCVQGCQCRNTVWCLAWHKLPEEMGYQHDRHIWYCKTDSQCRCRILLLWVTTAFTLLFTPLFTLILYLPPQ